jgi:dihydropteroate synthase type 2
MLFGEAMGHGSTTTRPELVAIVNLGPESFSDGGLYADPVRAERHAREMLASCADWVELGAASSHPDAPDVSDAEEMARLDAVLDRLGDVLGRVVVDSCKPAVQRHCLARGVGAINDIDGFAEPELYDALARASCRLIVMHRRGSAARARTAQAGEAADGFDAIVSFLQARVEALQAAGVARERIWIDPGMGLFLGDEPGPSLAALRDIGRLKAALRLPVLISVSRKSFLGAISGRAVHERAAATLAAELFAVERGADAVRTHDVVALADALAVRRALLGDAGDDARGSG